MSYRTIFVKEAKHRNDVQHIESFLSTIPGIERALLDMDDGEIKIEYKNNPQTYQNIVDSLESQGYHVSY